MCFFLFLHYNFFYDDFQLSFKVTMLGKLFKLRESLQYIYHTYQYMSYWHDGDLTIYTFSLLIVSLWRHLLYVRKLIPQWHTELHLALGLDLNGISTLNQTESASSMILVWSRAPTRLREVWYTTHINCVSSLTPLSLLNRYYLITTTINSWLKITSLK